MRVLALACFAFLCTALLASAEEDKAFFEKKYKVALQGVGDLDSYSDPDEFYSAVAARLEIPAIAFKEVSLKEGWIPSNSPVLNSVVRRTQGNWLLLVCRYARLDKSGRPDQTSLQSRFCPDRRR